MSDETQTETTLLGHLLELRQRLMRIFIGIGVVFLCCAPFANPLYNFAAQPLIDQMPASTSMIAMHVASPFLTPFKFALFVAVFVTMPFTLHQIWGFVAPGLYRHERRIATPLLLTSILLFYVGVAFAYYVVFPLMFGFFTKAAPAGVAVMPDIGAYLDFILTIFFAFGLAFEVPIATVLLVWIGITTPAALAQKRAYVLLAAFVGGMFLTPPDMISQTLLAIPVYLLFELGILLSRAVVPRGARDASEA